MTDNRTTELLDGLRHVGNLHEFAELFGFDWHDDSDWTWHDVAVKMADVLEQAIAATLGRPKAKSHPYGYERDTGAYDCTRCECGCINDISAMYCNDCGGEIEIDESAEKEYYDGYSKHTVFAKKHDDGTLEFCERRYVPEDAATLGRSKVKKVCGTWYGPAGEEYDGLACSGCGEWIDGDLDCIGEYDGPNFCHNCGGEFDGPLLCKRCGKLAHIDCGDMCAECYWGECEGNDER